MKKRAQIFLYGTLCDPDLLGIVAGTHLPARPAQLAGHRVAWAEGQNFPLILKAPGEMVDGLLVKATGTEQKRLDFYELGFGYALRPMTVETDTGPEEALIYFPDPDYWKPGAMWSLANWQRDHGALTRDAAIEYMRLMPGLTPARAAVAFPQVRMRASSRLRAASHPSPSALAPHMEAGKIELLQTSQPYTDFFAVREDLMSFPRFDGTMSPPVKRATFMGGDAVTVLPYDPARDEVLVVRQFRHGAFVRGDVNPWCLEPVAGRIDPGETASQTALRELREEAGLTARDLHLIARYYPSPGAYSEFLISFVAIAPLDGRDLGIGGLSSEAEDIMAHTMPFSQLMSLIESGAANTGPLIVSAQWLAVNREHLRTAH